MSIEVIGSYPEIQRVVTGLYSLDRAFTNDLEEIGVPVGHCWEIFGTSHTGKSSFTYALSGILASKQNKNIVLCDFEGFDPRFTVRLLENVGFSNKLQIVREEEDEDQLDKMSSVLASKDYCIAILDSISAISPLAEMNSELGEANMGRRAFLMAQLSRKVLHIFRFNESDPKTLLMINHWLPQIGSRGYQAPGGAVKSFLASVRVKLKRVEEYPDGSYILQGEVVKNRWGYKDKVFYVFMLAGKGIHYGLTAIYDCIISGKITYKNGVLRKDGESLGRLSKFVKEAKLNNYEIFDQFFIALEEPSSAGSNSDEELIGKNPEDND